MDTTTYSLVSPAISKVAGNNDLLTQILSRVPARPLFRFKCVSRSWRRLISDDRQLGLLHSSRNPTPASSGLFSFSSYSFFWVNHRLILSPPPPAISFLQSVSCSRILQSSNGLLLCASSLPGSPYFVCNPVLPRLSNLDLPQQVQLGGVDSLLGLTLVFDASRWAGFKVVCVSTSAIHVYSSPPSSLSWKTAVLLQEELNLAFEGAYRNGKAIWLCKETAGWGSYIVFDIDKGTLKTHSLPCQYSMVCYFGESMGELHLLAKVDGEAFHLYQMGEDMEWALKMSVMESVMRAHLTRGYSPICSSVWSGSWVVTVVRKGDVYLVVWYLPSGSGRVISYNCNTRLTICLAESTIPGKIFDFFETLYWI